MIISALLALVLCALGYLAYVVHTRLPKQPTTPRTNKSRTAQEKKVAFVLSGGGVKGAAQAGMLVELFRAGIYPDCLYGASVGALNAAAIACNPSMDAALALEELWSGLESDEIFPRSFGAGKWQALQRRAALHPNTGLKAVAESVLEGKQFSELALPLSVVATSFAEAQSRWLTSGPVVPAVLASAALPGIYPPVEINGEPLVDGGILDNAPIEQAVRDGATEVYVLLCSSPHYQPPPPRRPLESMLVALSVAVHARFLRDLERVPASVTTHVIYASGQPQQDYKDFSEVADYITAGRQAVLDYLTNFAETPQADAQETGHTKERAILPNYGALTALEESLIDRHHPHSNAIDDTTNETSSPRDTSDTKTTP